MLGVSERVSTPWMRQAAPRAPSRDRRPLRGVSWGGRHGAAAGDLPESFPGGGQAWWTVVTRYTPGTESVMSMNRASSASTLGLAPTITAR